MITPLTSSKPSSKWRNAALLFGAWTVVGISAFLYRYLDDVARGHTGTFFPRLIEEATGAYAAALLFPLLLKFVRWYPIDRTNWVQRTPPYVGVVVAMSAAHTTMLALSRGLLFPLFGLGAYDYGNMHVRYWMEMSNDVLYLSVLVGLIRLFDSYRAARDHEVRAAQLESQLAQSQLQNLRLQLHPHFLFNALNTVSAVMYDDPARADRMLGDLSELLRLTLREQGVQETSLGDELRLLDRYLDIMRARFEERLTVTVDADSEIHSALVPQLMLQPLVENAIRHGFNPASSRGDIELRCARENGALVVVVRDHGAGISELPSAVIGRGIGLSNTAARLARLYGDRHRLELANASGGGLQVTISLPYHTA